MTLLIIIAALALVLSFLCSLMEAVLLSLNPLRLRGEGPNGPRHAERWLGLKRRIELPIAVLTVVNTLARSGGAIAAGVAWVNAHGMRWLWAFALVFLVVLLLGSEIVPKVIGVRCNAALARGLGWWLERFTRMMAPLVAFTDGFSNLVRRGIRSAEAPGFSDVEVMDLVTLAQTARAEQLIHSREELIIIHAATLSARRVSTAMVPREDVSFFRLDQSLAHNLKRLSGCPFSRFPVSADESPDGIAWMLHSKHLLERAEHGDEPAGETRLEPLLTVAPGDTLTQALCAMLESDAKLAQVRRADGRFVGLLVLNDIVEVLVGRGRGIDGGREPPASHVPPRVTSHR